MLLLRMVIAVQDLVDIVERPMHRFGIHSSYLVIAVGLLGVLFAAATTLVLRRMRR